MIGASLFTAVPELHVVGTSPLTAALALHVVRITMDCFEAPRMGLNLIFIKVSAAPTGALGPWKVEEP